MSVQIPNLILSKKDRIFWTLGSNFQERMSDLTENREKDESWVPKIDMIFETDEKAYHFYCLYAREMGFGVRKHLVKRRSSGLVYSRVFSCYKEGFARSIKEGKKPRPDARTGCGAHLTVRIMDDGKYRVSEFDPNHNHDLAKKFNEFNNTYNNSNNNNSISSSAGVKRVSKSGITINRAQIKISVPSKIASLSGKNLVPKTGMEFEDDDEAYQFYVNYANSIGFSVRKNLVKRRASGVVYGRTFVCHKEGFKRKRGDESERKPKPYDRTGCAASLSVQIMKNGRFRVTEFEPKHNHPLVIPSKAHLIKWRCRKIVPSRLISLRDENLGFQNDLIDERCDNRALVLPNCKNYIPRKRKHAMRGGGELGAILEYFHEKQITDPSFYYALQLDSVDRVTNIFWTDAKSRFDFQCFGDVVCLDTSYRNNEYIRPLALFLGINHHKQVIIFGSGFLFDESEESLKWILETFKSAMCGPQPKTVLTARHMAVRDMLASIWSGMAHRFCVWQVYNEAYDQLNSVFLGSTTFSKDFSRCIYDFEEREEFESEWEKLLQEYDLKSNDYLNKLYEDRANWALPYLREIFCGDIKGTLSKDHLISSIHKCLKQDLDFPEFINQYERIVDDSRKAELHADLNANQISIQFPFARILKQAVNTYTPAVFKQFQIEFEMSLDCLVYPLSQTGIVFEYKVMGDDPNKVYLVRFDSSDITVECSCKKFDFTGLPCRHMIKMLDIVNVKELPDKYILKRWTKDAKKITNNNSNNDNDNNNNRSYRLLCSVLERVAVRAAESTESYALVSGLLDQIMNRVHQILQGIPQGDGELN